jgi:hypothetical protein
MQDNKKMMGWPRLRDIPDNERAPFDAWLDGQTRPLVNSVPDEDQDFYYPWDFDRWKAGLPIID